MFIVLEGIDGCGKTTQLKFIKEYFEENFPDKKVIVTREPGGTECPTSEKIRDVILYNEMDEYSRALLYAASRYEHQLKIKEWLDKDYIVICDRYIYSSLAYQSNENITMDEILSINRYNEIVKPDLILFFRIDLDTFHARTRIRLQERELDVMEKKSDKYFLSAIKGYIEAFRKVDEYLIEVDGTKSIEETRNNVEKELNKFFCI